MTTAGDNHLIVVVGMRREARIVGPRARVLVGGRGIGEALSDGAAGILSFGICGGLDPALHVGDLVVGTGVVSEAAGRRLTDPVWSDRLAAALPNAARGEFASSNFMVASPTDKTALRKRSGAACADMESHVVAAIAGQAGLPFTIVRAVSDAADHGLPRAARVGLGVDGKPNVGAVIAALLRQPLELPPLIRTALRAGRAFRALESVVDTVLAIRP